MSTELNDSRLTAYALGELDPQEIAAVEEELKHSAAARAEVEAIRAGVGPLTDALGAEPVMELTDEQRARVEAAAADSGSLAIAAASGKAPRSIWMTRWAVAASILLVCATGFALWTEFTDFGIADMLALSRARELTPAPAQPTREGRQNTPNVSESNAVLRTKERQSGHVNETMQKQLENLGYLGYSVDPGHKQSTSGKRGFDGSENGQTIQQAQVMMGGGRGRGKEQRENDAGDSNVYGPVSSLGYIEAKLAELGDRLDEVDVSAPAGGDVSWTYDRSAFDQPAHVVDNDGVSVIAHSNNRDTAGRPMAGTKLDARLYYKLEALKNYGEDGDGTPDLLYGLGYIDPDAESTGLGCYLDPAVLHARLEPNSPESTTDNEFYETIYENPFQNVELQPLSTFSIDVDTASYSNVRRFLNNGQMPPANAVRIEELLNYFNYDYPEPEDEHPFAAEIEVAECPWRPEHRLARVGIKGMEVAEEDRPDANLVFLLDVSGSMSSQNKLPLVKEAMRMLVHNLNDEDRVGIVTYAGEADIVLDSTSIDDEMAILEAIDSLDAGGSTNGGQGIEMAYNMAIENYIEGGINRVILATDGDFNVGITNRLALINLIESQANDGIFLTALGFGMGNLKDATLEQLADKGNGHYAYVDDLDEAERILVERLGGTLMTIAKDVKIQIEFNPTQVEAYRLIGYENRRMAARDFNDDTKDAGEIGAGHTVTALYEIVPAGIAVEEPDVDPLKYQPVTTNDTDDTDWAEDGAGDDYASGDDWENDDATEAWDDEGPAAEFAHELLTLKIRYKQPEGSVSELLEYPVVDEGYLLDETTDDFRFAASVASFGMLLRGSAYSGDFTYDDVYDLADGAIGDDPTGEREAFLELVDRAMKIGE